MAVVWQLTNWLTILNNFLLKIGRNVSWICIGLMTIAILIQVFFRYVLNNALPWPEEASRALMIWMMALAAPSAYQHGGFVAINLLGETLPRMAKHILMFAILILSLCVLYYLVIYSYDFFQRGFRATTATIRWPVLVIDPETGNWAIEASKQKLKSAWVRLAMPIGFFLLVLVTIQLFLEELKMMITGEKPDREAMGSTE